MKQFFKMMFASALGVILASILAILILFGIVSVLASQNDEPTKLKPHSVYVLDLKGLLVDRSEEDPMSAVVGEIFSDNTPAQIGLDDVLNNIDKAEKDSNIVGIYLRGGILSGGYASFREIRDALLKFKASGKFIIAYADVYEQNNYYLASVADKIYLNPEGMLDWKGLSAQLMFFKNTLDKLGVEMQVVKVGTFKSAVEPFINTSMSDANRLQVTRYVSSIWNDVVNQVSKSRKVNPDSLKSYADKMMLFQSSGINVKAHLVDQLVYQTEMDTILKKKFSDYQLVDHNAMNTVSADEIFHKDKIAVLYASGGIDDDPSDGIQSDDITKTIIKLRDDKNVKAVVLRVNSPGGSAYGSEQIWHALTLLKQKKPLVVSMSDYAASGGYYISTPADVIIAQPNTITGSIGIFGLIPNIGGLDEKLGFTYDVVNTNKLSDMPNLNRKMTEGERLLMQNFVNKGYATFVKRCADGRKLTMDSIHSIAEGRVWTGEDALKIGLVDKLGGLDVAIKVAAKRAKISEYAVKSFPEKENFSTRLMKSIERKASVKIFSVKEVNEYVRLFNNLMHIREIDRVQARLPYFIEFK